MMIYIVLDNIGCKNIYYHPLLAAKDAILDSHLMDVFDHEDVVRAFNIPDNYLVPMPIATGHFNK
jgi:hypothetical protein